MKKIIFWHSLCILGLFFWHTDKHVAKKPIKVMTHQVIQAPAKGAQTQIAVHSQLKPIQADISQLNLPSKSLVATPSSTKPPAPKQTPSSKKKELTTSKASTIQKKPTSTTQKPLPAKTCPAHSSANEELVSLMEKSLNSLQVPTNKTKPIIGIEGRIGELKSTQHSYVDQLIANLQQKLCFPEMGDVYVQICVNRSGHILTCTVLDSLSKANKEYVLAILPTLKLPSFNEDYKELKTQTFRIKLTSEK